MGLIEAIQHYANNPVHFVKDIIGVEPEPEQAKVLTALAGSSQICVKSGHGIGKTAVEAWAQLWFLSTRPHSKVPCTAPTQHQLEDILWPEVKKWLNRSRLKNAFEWTKTRMYMRGHAETWFSVPRACSKPENLQGFHSENLLFLIDEAPGIPEEILEVVFGALTQEGKLLMCGNPTRISGSFYDAFHKDRAQYKTFTFSSEKSNLVTAEYCNRIAEKYGRESDVYRVRVAGQFPQGTPDALISLADTEPAVKRIVEEGGKITIGVDPARYGDDSTEICVKEGLSIQFSSFHGINTTRCAGEVIRIVKEIRKTGYEKKIEVRVDATGIGAGVVDQLEPRQEEFNIEVIPVNFGDTATDKDYYLYNSQMWGEAKEALKTMSIPDDPEFISQLTTRKYTVRPDGRIQIERKIDMKKRGLKSPDKADAFCLAICQPLRITWRPV